MIYITPFTRKNQKQIINSINNKVRAWRFHALYKEREIRREFIINIVYN
jgi:hypothetical protein